MKRLLVHICCAPDATVGIERLGEDWTAEGFFYNPNIHPAAEYLERLHTMKALSEATGFTFLEGSYDPESWKAMVRGLENEPEKGTRCTTCIEERLRTTARVAAKNGFDAFAAVLTVSPHKDAGMVNRLGAKAGEEFGVEYVPTDLKKLDGFKRSMELSRRFGLYRQDYCGCVYSRNRGNKPADSGNQG